MVAGDIREGDLIVLNPSLGDGSEEINLSFTAPLWVADNLREIALSSDQIINDNPQDPYRTFKITATVLNTAQLRWWLSHFGAEIELIAPLSLRKEFIEEAKALADLYLKDGTEHE